VAFGAPTPYQPRSREKNFGHGWHRWKPNATCPWDGHRRDRIVCAAAARDRSIHCRKVIVTSFI
jgi:hypothetical protein